MSVQRHSVLELLAPYLQHRETCDKWRKGWWDGNEDCTCGLEAALIQVDERIIEDIAV